LLKVAHGCCARQQRPVLAARTNRFWRSGCCAVWILCITHNHSANADLMCNISILIHACI
jgi:hypothetical protein